MIKKKGEASRKSSYTQSNENTRLVSVFHATPSVRKNLGLVPLREQSPRQGLECRHLRWGTVRMKQ